MKHRDTLADLPEGGRGVIAEIRADGAEQERLARLGLIAGTVVECRMRGSGGSPIAFSARGAALALRRETCRRIFLREIMTDSDTRGKTFLLAGNPNVGKSTVFNALTGMRQHTGNWCGKTVSGAEGSFSFGGTQIRLIDTPGTYSLHAAGAEESAAADVIFTAPHDCIICVVDACCMERGLRLALELLEMHRRLVLCVNLMDEAQKKQIKVNLPLLSDLLGIPVIGVTAHKKQSLIPLIKAALDQSQAQSANASPVQYSEPLETAADCISQAMQPYWDETRVSVRFAALQMLRAPLHDPWRLLMPFGIGNECSIKSAVQRAQSILAESGIRTADLCLETHRAVIRKASDICAKTVNSPPHPHRKTDRFDRLLTHRTVRIPLMLLLVLTVFWITLRAANYPSALLAAGFSALCDLIRGGMNILAVPQWLTGAVVDGILRGTGWVVSVMLPPMMIFFPLFTLLEDVGLLPRIAFHLDSRCAKCRACGKQTLTMTMGFGCNAVGVTECRIIESRRERLIAILTNALVPCNGRFPALLAIVTVFFAGTGQPFRAACILTGLIMLSIAVTFGASALLGKTVLRGEPSSFILELPPYRRPQIAQILVRSLFDRTLRVLGRAVTVAAPVSLLIWIAANVQIAGGSILMLFADALAPAGHFLGMDGVMLLAFLLGMPANEIVLPVAVTAYSGSTVLPDYGPLSALHTLLTANGWTLTTAACFLVFTLFHAPCATTLLTVRHETQSRRWTVAAFLLPTLIGCCFCAVIAAVSRMF